MPVTKGENVSEAYTAHLFAGLSLPQSASPTAPSSEGAIVKHGKCKLKASWYYLASFEKRGVKQTSDAHDKKQYIDTYTKATLHLSLQGGFLAVSHGSLIRERLTEAIERDAG